MGWKYYTFRSGPPSIMYRENVSLLDYADGNPDTTWVNAPLYRRESFNNSKHYGAVTDIGESNALHIWQGWGGNESDFYYTQFPVPGGGGTPDGVLTVPSYCSSAQPLILNTVDITGETAFDVLAPINPETEPSESTNSGLYLKFSGARVKLDSITEIISFVKIINGLFDEYPLPTLKTWIHILKNIHPLVDKETSTLKYFSPMSEEIGSTHYIHTIDTQSLALGCWGTYAPQCLRRALQYKIDTDMNNMLVDTYYKLNTNMSKNLSREFYEGDIDHGRSKLSGKTLYNNDFHLAGDYNFTIIINRIKTDLLTIINNDLKETNKLITWLEGINTYTGEIPNNKITIKLEGNDVIVDLKGGKSGVIATAINVTPIS